MEDITEAAMATAVTMAKGTTAIIAAVNIIVAAHIIVVVHIMENIIKIHNSSAAAVRAKIIWKFRKKHLYITCATSHIQHINQLISFDFNIIIKKK